MKFDDVYIQSLHFTGKNLLALATKVLAYQELAQYLMMKMLLLNKGVGNFNLMFQSNKLCGCIVETGNCMHNAEADGVIFQGYSGCGKAM